MSCVLALSQKGLQEAGSPSPVSVCTLLSSSSENTCSPGQGGVCTAAGAYSLSPVLGTPVAFVSLFKPLFLFEKEKSRL